jgi:hypothetical protein
LLLPAAAGEVLVQQVRVAAVQEDFELLLVYP